MSIFDSRLVYKPFEYTFCYDYMKLQQRVHWLPEEVSLSSDLNDWKSILTENEKQVVGNILKSFAQTETAVEDYWSGEVAFWLPKPEIRSMAITFAGMESIHAEAYSLLNEALDLSDFSAYLQDQAAMAKMQILLDGLNYETKSRKSFIISLAVFSAFTEGVNLFSSFAVLMSFQLRNLMKGMAQIIEWSVRDESLHSRAGCHLFRQVVEESEYSLRDLWPDIVEACYGQVELEFNFIDQVFKGGRIEGISPDQLKNFIRHRANEKLKELGYNTKLHQVDEELLKTMEWFSHLTSGKSHTDFFEATVTDYSKGRNWDNV